MTDLTESVVYVSRANYQKGWQEIDKWGKDDEQWSAESDIALATGLWNLGEDIQSQMMAIYFEITENEENFIFSDAEIDLADIIRLINEKGIYGDTIDDELAYEETSVYTLLNSIVSWFAEFVEPI